MPFFGTGEHSSISQQLRMAAIQSSSLRLTMLEKLLAGVFFPAHHSKRSCGEMVWLPIWAILTAVSASLTLSTHTARSWEQGFHVTGRFLVRSCGSTARW